MIKCSVGLTLDYATKRSLTLSTLNHWELACTATEGFIIKRPQKRDSPLRVSKGVLATPNTRDSVCVSPQEMCHQWFAINSFTRLDLLCHPKEAVGLNTLSVNY